jgi:predicted permease
MMRLPFLRRNVQREIDEELRFHFDARIEELVGQGMTPDDARAQAHSEFGDVNHVRDGLREIDDRVARRRQRDLFDVVRQDFTYAARSLRRTPGVSITIILTLALGLGVNAAMFSLLDVLFFRPPAGVANPNEIRRLWTFRNFRDAPQFWPGFDYSRYNAVRQALAGRAQTTLYRMPEKMAYGTGENPPAANVSSASASYFSVLGVKPAIGRFYNEDEDALDNAANVAVLSYAFWKRAYDGDQSALGRRIVFGKKPYTIIGVAPPRFSGVDLDAVEVWVPLSSAPGNGGRPSTPWYRNPAVNGFQIMFRLLPSARPAELEQIATAALRQPGIGYGQDTSAIGRFGSIIRARGPGLISGEMQVAERLGGVAIIVLIIACANVVNLLLARAFQRRREIAVRLALGISRARLVRLLVTESVLLAVAAMVAALAAASWGGTLLRTLLLPDIAWAENPLHWRVLFFGLLAALLAGAVTGLVPALQARSTDLTNALKAGSRESGGHRSRIRSFLVVCQAALSVVLLVGAALFLRSLSNIHALDIGYAVNRLAFVSVNYPTSDSVRERTTSARLLQLEPRMASIPGVERIAFTSMRPVRGFGFADGFFPDADTIGHRKPAPIFTAVSPTFFEATGTNLIRGQTFSAHGAGSPFTVIINDAMAKALWPNQEPIGRCIRFERPDAPCATIIGISQTAILTRVKEEPSPHMYLPIDNMPFSSWGVGDIVIRTDPSRMTSALNGLRGLLRTEFPGAKLATNTMAATMEPQYRPWQLGATLFTLFGALAALVAAIGIYSSVSYAVNQRTHEFGVRAALGADPRSIITQVLGEGTRTVAVGVALGIVLAIVAGRLIASLLYGVSAGNPFAMAGAGGSMIVVAGLACLAPAWRAARSDPVAALRSE